MKAILKKAWAGFVTAVTSSAVEKQEKNIAVTVITGVLLSIGASDGLVQLVSQVVNSL